MKNDNTPESFKEGFSFMMQYFATRLSQGWTDDHKVDKVVRKGLLPKENAQKIVPTARMMWEPYQNPSAVAEKSVFSSLIEQLKSPNKNKRYDSCHTSGT